MALDMESVLDRTERWYGLSVVGKYRVHASPVQPQGEKAPYLTMEALPGGKVRFDFASMLKESEEAEPVVEMPMSSVYLLLEGQEILIETGAGTVKMSPRSDEIIIDCTEIYNPNVRQYRVSLSEIALAWNMIQGQRYE